MTSSRIDLAGRHIVSTAWLAEHLGAPNLALNLVVLDASYYLPAEKRDPWAEYLARHIEGARFFDIEAISDTTSTLPHMMPTAEKFASSMRALGVGSNDAVVAYDGTAPGLMSAGRAWWMLRAFGHDNVAILDGGMKKWSAENRPLTNAAPKPRDAGPFHAKLRPSLLRTLDDMRKIVASGSSQIADARGPGRFAGRDAEPRPGLRSGHMPGARSVPFNTLLKPDGTLLEPAALRAAFAGAGIDLEKPIVTSCGSGVSAAVISLALAVLGKAEHGLYDGSWSEWGQASLDTPVVTAAS